MDEDRRMVSLEEVPTDGTLLVTLGHGDDDRNDGGDSDDDGGDRVDGGDGDDDDLMEAILLRVDDGVVAYRNYCQHWTDVRLDKGSGALVRNGEVVCQKHAATFESDGGYCNFGPCEGSYLETVDVDVEDEGVYLTDDEYIFEHLGPSGETPQSSGNRIDFTG